MAQAAWPTGRATSPDDRRIPRRWADRKTPEAVPLLWRRLTACYSAWAVSCLRLPRAPPPSSGDTVGLQLASSWTRDGCSVRRLCEAGISLACFVSWTRIRAGVGANKTGTMSGVSALAGYAGW